MKLTLKTFMPIIAVSTLSLTACDNIVNRAEKYMLKRNYTQTDLNDFKNYPLNIRQSKLDSIAYRDIFMSTKMAQDSSAVAEFNKIASKFRSNHSRPIDRIVDVNKKLAEAGITVKEMKNIEDATFPLFALEDPNLNQHLADDWVYRKFFEKIGVMDKKLQSKCDSVSAEIRPQ